MKSVALGVAVAAMFAAINPTSGQAVVRDRDDVIIRDHEHGRNRDRSWYRDRAECRTMRVWTHLPNSKVVLRARRGC